MTENKANAVPHFEFVERFQALRFFEGDSRGGQTGRSGQSRWPVRAGRAAGRSGSEGLFPGRRATSPIGPSRWSGLAAGQLIFGAPGRPPLDSTCADVCRTCADVCRTCASTCARIHNCVLGWSLEK